MTKRRPIKDPTNCRSPLFILGQFLRGYSRYHATQEFWHRLSQVFPSSALDLVRRTNPSVSASSLIARLLFVLVRFFCKASHSVQESCRPRPNVFVNCSWHFRIVTVFPCVVNVYDQGPYVRGGVSFANHRQSGSQYGVHVSRRRVVPLTLGRSFHRVTRNCTFQPICVASQGLFPTVQKVTTVDRRRRRNCGGKWVCGSGRSSRGCFSFCLFCFLQAGPYMVQSGAVTEVAATVPPSGPDPVFVYIVPFGAVSPGPPTRVVTTVAAVRETVVVI